jgi:hypothetical protein
MVVEALSYGDPIKSSSYNASNSKVGSRLMKLGAVIFFTPIPIVSEVTGGAMIIIGHILNRLGKNGGIDSLSKEINEIISDFREIIDEVYPT